MRMFWLVATFGLLAGCGSYGDRVPVIGVVTIDGAPLANVFVTFRPDDGEPGNGGFAITDSSGKFEISYPDTGKGLIPGRYKVTITPPPQEKSEGPPKPSPVKQMSKSEPGSYPPIYSSPENTPLRVTVTSDGQPVKVELSSTQAGKTGKKK